MLFDTAMESVSRNERIIKLLKHLKLDPEHPPEDFPGVYRYALVEYGVGKPRPVLEIFRQDKIQELFREALERNSPSILLKNGEAFLDDHPLQTDLQSNNVDVRREFYEFAAVFIEVAKRTRTPAEILAEQKLDSLHQQIGTLQERLSRLPTLEGMRTEMARLAAQDNPALPAGEAFNAEQCKAFALAQQMRGWFETLGFRFESHEVWQDDYFEWIINIPIRRGRYDRILVRGIDGEAGLRDVEELKQAVETHRTDEGWLITARRISRAARDEANKEENDGLGCYTLDELLDQDADFSGYLNWLESEIQKRGIAQKYVPLACLKEEVDPDTKQRIGVSRYDDRDGWIDGYIDLWLDDPAKEHISVLGEFGTGKTWFALHYAWKALQHYREAQKRGLDRPRLPLVIPLRDYAKAVSVESLFSEFFFRKHEIPIPGYSAFEQLNRMGKLLLIFDGFDEMAARVDRQEMINNFWELAKVVVPGAKVILTCRTEHFPDAREGRALLNAELQASTRDLTGETPQFEVLELEKFNDQQIRQVLKYQTQPTTVEQIMSNPQLLDLARRPVLTELILEALPDIEAGKPVDMSRVYLYAVHHKMERDIKAERTFTSMADKLYFMCELSWEMLRTDRMSINYREFPNRIRQLFGPAVEEEKDLDHWHYDMMGQTMLIRNAEGDYTPAHRSLIEFFVAYKFSAELGLLSPDFVELVQDQSQLDIREASENHTWTSYFNRNSDLIEKYPPAISLRSFKCESLENLRSGFGKSVLTKALIDLMKPMFISNEDALFILKETCNKSKKDVGFIGGNIVNLLLAIDETALESKNLSETIITGADFTNASLRDTNLSYSCLRDATFANFFGSILSVAISPNNHFFATASSENGLIRLWDFTIRKELASMQGHVGGAWSVAFSPDNKLIASGSIDQTVRVWNLNTKECIAVLKGHEGWIRAVCFSPDGQILASGSHDRTIRLWSTKTGTLLRELIGHKGEVRSLTFCASGQLLISGGKEPSVRIWNIDDGKCTKVLEGHNGSIEALTLIPEQDLVASAGSDQTIRLWEVSTGKCLRVFSGHSGWIESMAFDAKTRTIASGSQDLTIRLWDIDTGKCRRVLRGHTSSVRALGFSNEQAILVSGSRDQTLRFWNTLNGDTIQVLRGFNNSARTIALSNDDQYLVSGGDDQLLRLWDLAAGRCIKILQRKSDWIRSVTFNPQNKIVASAGNDNLIRLWDVESGEHLKTFVGHQGWVRSIAFTSDGFHLVSGSTDKTIKIWDVASGNLINTIEGHQDAVLSISLSQDNRLIASGGYDQDVRIWNTNTGECEKILKGHVGWVRSVVFSPSCDFIVSCGDDRQVRLWEVKSGRYLLSLKKSNDLTENPILNSVAISPDEKMIATGNVDGTVDFWSMPGGEHIRTVDGRANQSLSVTFSSDSNFLAVGNGTGTIQFWDVYSGTQLKVLKDSPYMGMNIIGVEGLNTSEREMLITHGAVGD